MHDSVMPLAVRTQGALPVQGAFPWSQAAMGVANTGPLQAKAQLLLAVSAGFDCTEAWRVVLRRGAGEATWLWVKIKGIILG